MKRISSRTVRYYYYFGLLLFILGTIERTLEKIRMSPASSSVSILVGSAAIFFAITAIYYEYHGWPSFLERPFCAYLYIIVGAVLAVMAWFWIQ